MAANIDRLTAAKWLRSKADELLKEAEADTSSELFGLNEAAGVTEISSKLFDGVRFKYSKTRAKTVIQYNRADGLAFQDWLEGNPEAMISYISANAEAFGKWWFEETGEVPDGIARVEYTEEARTGAPKLYGYDSENVEQTIMDNHLLAGFGGLLTGGAE